MLTAALLIRMSTPPNRSSADCANRCRISALERSVATAMASAPMPLISATASASGPVSSPCGSTVRAAMITLAPRRARTSAGVDQLAPGIPGRVRNDAAPERRCQPAGDAFGYRQRLISCHYTFNGEVRLHCLHSGGDDLGTPSSSFRHDRLADGHTELLPLFGREVVVLEIRRVATRKVLGPMLYLPPGSPSSNSPAGTRKYCMRRSRSANSSAFKGSLQSTSQ